MIAVLSCVAGGGRRETRVTEDMDELRRQLAARVAACFDRLDDAVSELYALHSVDADEIHSAVEATIEREARSEDEPRLQPAD
jgi:hypothetical protein